MLSWGLVIVVVRLSIIVSKIYLVSVIVIVMLSKCIYVSAICDSHSQSICENHIVTFYSTSIYIKVLCVMVITLFNTLFIMGMSF